MAKKPAPRRKAVTARGAKEAAKAAKPRIAAATGTASASLSPAGKNMAREIEAAMSRAVLQAGADGVNDPAEVRERMLAARDFVKKAHGL